MINSNASLLTIYTESALETQLTREIEDYGATGYTITNARGKGSGGERTASWEANSNIRIEVICNTDMAITLSQHLKDKYYDDYAMVTFICDIEVQRPDKFTG